MRYRTIGLLFVTFLLAICTQPGNTDDVVRGYAGEYSRAIARQSELMRLLRHLKADDSVVGPLHLQPDDLVIRKTALDPNVVGATVASADVDEVDQERLRIFLKSLANEFSKFDVNAVTISQCLTDFSTTVGAYDALIEAGLAGNEAKVAQNLWASQMLDATGLGTPRGLQLGNFFVLGSYQECRRASPAKFNGLYCTAIKPSSYLGQTVNLTRGYCVPDSCNDKEVQTILNFGYGILAVLKNQNPLLDAKLVIDISIYIDNLLHNRSASVVDIDKDLNDIAKYGIKQFNLSLASAPNTIICHPRRDITSDTTAVAMIAFLSVIGVLMLFGTLYDVFSYQYAIEELPTRRREPKEETFESASMVGTARSFEPPELPTRKEYYDSLPLIVRCVMAFSIYTNCQRILDTSRREGTLDCIHGIRFISMTWVILGHSYYYAQASTDNLLVARDAFGTFSMQAIGNATLSVDTFFLISGLLLTFLWFKETEKKKAANLESVQFWVMYYVHRFLRLTPIYMLILGVDAALLVYFGNGPFWPVDGFEPYNCKYWWRNFLYIQNFFTVEDMCMGHTWYLANDMQFYILAPIFLVLTYFSWFIGFILGAVIIIASAIGRGYVIATKNFDPLGAAAVDPNKFYVGWGFFNEVYMTPWMRIGPYIVGLMFGYALFKALSGGKRKMKMNKIINIVGWLLAFGMALTVIYGVYDVLGRTKPFPEWAHGLYCGIARTVWAVAVGWVCFSCCTGNGGIVNSILSFRMWIPLSRLTYCAYLVHPLVMGVFYNGHNSPIHFDNHFTFVYYYFGHCIMAYMVALLFSLMLEAPALILEKLLLPTAEPRKPQTKVYPITQLNGVMNSDQVRSSYAAEFAPTTYSGKNLGFQSNHSDLGLYHPSVINSPVESLAPSSIGDSESYIQMEARSVNLNTAF